MSKVAEDFSASCIDFNENMKAVQLPEQLQAQGTITY